ncbi:MAG: imelysin family protein [Bacteroidota bacterium]
MKFSIMLAMLTTLAAAGLAGCGESDKDPQGEALSRVKAFITTNISDLSDANAKLQAAAPAPDADGWTATADAAAVMSMKTQWKRARVAYENIEGAIAVLFPELDYSTDQRYDAFLADNGPDTNLFDNQNVTGIHAIERILWSDMIPAPVVTFEQTLPGFKAAAFPTTSQQADDFKNKLCARLVADVKMLRDQFGPLALDSGAAFRGVIGSMGEQLEKAELAASGEEESRYAAYTLADMRTNVNAGVKTFEAFKPWLKSKKADQQIQKIDAAFVRVNGAYTGLTGDALPAVPATWSSQQPTAADLQTPFGMLWTVLHDEADPDTAGTLVYEMNAAADILGIPQLPE